MNHRFIRTLVFALGVLAASAPAHAAPRVLASIKPVHSLVAAVMQGIGTPGLIVSGSGSPHDYALKPSDARALADSEVIFWIGPDLESFLHKPIATLAHAARSIALIQTPGLEQPASRTEGSAHEPPEPHRAGADEHHHADADGHVWLDPDNAALLVGRIAAVLAEADPANASGYAANAAALAPRIAALKSELAAVLAPVSHRPYVVFHDAYRHFEHRFALNPVGAITVRPETSPSAGRISEIRDRMRRLGAVCVFAEPQFPPRLVELVREGSAARSAVLDPLGAALEPGPDLYFALMRDLGRSIAACLASD